MEQRELLLLEKYAAVNPELKELWEDHILYEKQVEKLEAKAYRTPTAVSYTHLALRCCQPPSEEWNYSDRSCRKTPARTEPELKSERAMRNGLCRLFSFRLWE